MFCFYQMLDVSQAGSNHIQKGLLPVDVPIPQRGEFFSFL
jgi:hypothetical protein